MKKREDIVQKFSTFLSFEDSKSGLKPLWQAEPELERHMKRLAQSDPEAKEEFWARHFLKILRVVSQTEKSSGTENEEDIRRQGRGSGKNSSTSLSTSSLRAGMHLSAYFQEACLWAAQKSYRRFTSLRHKYPLEEYFQIANSAVNPPAKLLRSFNCDRSQTNLEGYAKTAIIRFIGNTIYQQDLEAKREKFSDYGLLKDLTHRELREALLSQGINQPQIKSYSLAWQCLDEICQPTESQGSRSLPPPNQKHLQHIASCYNQRCNQLDFPAAPASEEKIQEMLSTCIQAAREHRTKRFLPLESFSNMPDPMPTPWDVVIQQEEWKQVQDIVLRLFEAIPEPGQTMLKLWQGLNLTQTEMTTVLRNKYPELQKQYQVARQLGRYTKTLLKDFVNAWKNVNPELCLNGDKDIERIKESLDECLQFQCQKVLRSALERIAEQWNDEEKVLVFHHRLNMNEKIRSEPLNISLSEAFQKISEIKTSLMQSFKAELEKSMELEPHSLDLVNNKVANFIDEWLKSQRLILKSGDGNDI